MIIGFFVAAGRKFLRGSIAIAFIGCSPTLPWIWKSLTNAKNFTPSISQAYHHFIWYLNQQFQLFDHGLGRAAMYGALVLITIVFIGNIIKCKIAKSPIFKTSEDKLAFFIFIALVVAYIITPVELASAGAWGG
ncbi:MAG: hypothetical protein JW841_11070 [Deltaproteobacteria bacterium]|nr:hypothetical protein [Deltaproteobacteria bacterium]